MIKTYILDTNVLLHNPNALFSFEDNNVILPDVVIDELDNHKRDKGEIGANARAAARFLDKMREDKDNGDLLSGYKMPDGGTLRIEMNCLSTPMPDTWKDSPDLRILRVCKGLLEKAENKNSIILVSNDSYVRIKASILNIKAEEFLTERAPSPEDLYQGRRVGYLNNEDIDKLYKEGTISKDKIVYLDKEEQNEIEMPEILINEYILIKGLQNPKQSALAFYNGKEIQLMDTELQKHNPYDITPKNVGQRFVLDALQKPASEAPLVIVKGPAGTGKTLLALAVGLEQVVENRKYRKILYLRGNTKLDEDIGFLPGTEEEKMDWALRPVRDNLEVILGGVDRNEKMSSGKKNKDSDLKYQMNGEDILKDKCDEIFDRGYISIEAIAHMRGRSIAGTYVIIDEAQNLTPKQVRTLISRASKDTKIILMGDPYQIDHPFLDFRTNGLCFAADRMAGSAITCQVSMLEEECERSELSLEVSKRMGDK